MSLGKSLEHSSVDKLQHIIALRRLGRIDFGCALQKLLGICQILATQIQQLPMFSGFGGLVLHAPHAHVAVVDVQYPPFLVCNENSIGCDFDCD
jgi:hypothetical protein